MKSSMNFEQSVFKCSRCGNCQYYCPAYNVSKRETHLARGKLQLIKKYIKEGQEGFSETQAKRMNQCLLCGNCSQNCPAGICTEDAIEKTREICYSQLGAQKMLEMTAKNVETVGNITGDSRENRLLWFENMPKGSVRVGGKAEYLYFAGCVPTLYPSSYSIPQSFAGLLNKAGLDWTVLGADENCCSYPLLIGGMKDAAVKTIKQNIQNVKDSGAKYIVTTCPSCYHTWKEIYPEIVPDMPDVKILHGAHLLTELSGKGVLKFKEMNSTVTYHDPCDLGRKSKVFEEPRGIIKAIPGVKLVEMKFNRESAFCCGGGGNLEMNDTELSGQVAQQRVGQALDTGADTIVTSCQQCKRTLAGGARQKRAKIKVMELSEFVMSAIE